MSYFPQTMSKHSTAKSNTTHITTLLPLASYSRVKDKVSSEDKDELVTRVCVASLSSVEANGLVAEAMKGWIYSLDGRSTSHSGKGACGPDMLDSINECFNVTSGTLESLLPHQIQYIDFLSQLNGLKRLYIFLSGNHIDCWILVEEKTHDMSKSISEFELYLEDNHEGYVFDSILLELDQLNVDEMPRPTISLEVKRG